MRHVFTIALLLAVFCGVTTADYNNFNVSGHNQTVDTTNQTSIDLANKPSVVIDNTPATVLNKSGESPDKPAAKAPINTIGNNVLLSLFYLITSWGMSLCIYLF